MKVILKGGSSEKNEEIKKFFMQNIFPILDFGIAIEPSDAVIVVYEKKNGKTQRYIDPTAEVIVELTEKARNMALNQEIKTADLERHTGKFHDEALAIRFIQATSLDFSIEFYSCNYKPPG